MDKENPYTAYKTDQEVQSDTSLSRRGKTARLLLPMVEHGVCWVLAALFIYSGLIKLIDPQRFAVIVSGFGLLPDALVFPVALFLPIMEVLTGVGLALGLRGSLTVLTGLLVLFMAVLVYGIHLGLDIDCGCFGPEDPEQAYKGLKSSLERDMVMMASVFFVYWSRGRVRLQAGRLK